VGVDVVFGVVQNCVAVRMYAIDQTNHRFVGVPFLNAVLMPFRKLSCACTIIASQVRLCAMPAPFWGLVLVGVVLDRVRYLHRLRGKQDLGPAAV
jgi:hypothetical protein